ncbi:DUF1289 domain-containing protein [Kushneria aurantia]|uniref:DUF1289 domain-containing protein n=1 Tax=Kushneria aurantia TaxID=504092 RepID=A0ABV6G3X8_9GAMM|nr:DUF1289 domain-containing protein [Kushneria aurantia]
MAKEIESPCVSVCQLKGNLCTGCGRSRDEIRRWQSMKRPEKMTTRQNAAARMKKLNRGKRQGS